MIRNPNYLVKLLSKISLSPEGVQIKDSNHPKLIEFFLSKGIIVKKNIIENTSSNKISLGLAAIQGGADVLEVCRLLSWKDFERFSSEILRFHDYSVYLNFRIKNPTRQIDIIGVRSKSAIIVDCKHWKYTSLSALEGIVRKQKERSALLCDKKQPLGIKKLYPVIVTFLQCEFQYIDDVPIVPIQNFNSFLLDFDNYNENFFHTQTSSDDLG
ncbi:MAG TPA: NERD domain-containing protein [Candidatus Nitrosocosmicus sp.]|nr:NERD domain-containing protein [Candidatus Nitrosocosmicus sp.]